MGVCLHVCLCPMCVLGAQEDQKKTLAPLELEFRMIASYHAIAGIKLRCIAINPLHLYEA